MASQSHKLGILAGSGQLPKLLIEAARQQDRDFFVLAFEGDTEQAIVENTSHQWLNIAEVARTLEVFKEQNVSEVVMAGKLSRPPLKALKPPILAAKIVKRLGKALFAGDNALFTAITRIFEEEGLQVIGADDILTSLLTPEGNLTKTTPNKQAKQDIEQAIQIVRTIGELDIGQGAMVKDGQVLGVEALEGTDALIARCAQLGNPHDEGGVLVKAKKPKQERRVDLPAIGPKTVENMHKAGFVGIAVEAGHSIIIDRKATLALADELGLFIVGFPHGS